MKNTNPLENQNSLSVKNFILATILAIISGYWIFIQEYDQGNYFYYFFKAKFYYAEFNKIIFPIGFWVIFLCYLATNKKLQPRASNHWKSSILIGVYLHLYLLAWTHWDEIVSKFSLLPVNLSDYPGKPVYERTVMSIGILAYNIHGFNLIFSKSPAPRPTGWQVIPISFLIPFFLTTHGISHFIFLFLAFTLILTRTNTSLSLIKIFEKNRYIGPILIFFISLGFRFWYATYINNQGDIALGFSADGPTYFHSAMAFSEGNYGKVDYYHAPFYALYLSVFLLIFGKTPATVFYSQAILGSLTPVLVYFITHHFLNKKAAFIAGLLAAASQIGIHHSVVCHRINPALWILSAITLLYLEKKSSTIKNNIGLGFLAGALFYIAQEMLPTILIFIGFWLSNIPKKFNDNNFWLKSTAGLLLGVFLAVAPLNVVFFYEYGKWIPLGRDTSLNKESVSIGIGNNSLRDELKNLGFDPLKKPIDSIDAIIQSPFKILSSSIAKIKFELPGFFFDPGSIFFQPLLLNVESFIGANLAFYYYGSIFLGFLFFINNKRIDTRKKLLIIIPLVAHSLTVTLFLYGTFRHRVPITLFAPIFIAATIDNFTKSFYAKKRGNFQGEEIKNQFLLLNFHKKILPLGLTYSIFIILVLIFIATLQPEKDGTKLKGYKIKNWLTINSKKGLAFDNRVLINSLVFTYYVTPPTNWETTAISFKICRPLTPKTKLYYRLALDGNFTHSGTLIKQGCHKVQHPFRPSFDIGMLTLVVYVSHNGKSPILTPSTIVMPERKSIKAPLIIDYKLDSILKENTQQFIKNSFGFVKVTSPKIIKQEPFSIMKKAK